MKYRPRPLIIHGAAAFETACRRWHEARQQCARPERLAKCEAEALRTAAVAFVTIRQAVAQLIEEAETASQDAVQTIFAVENLDQLGLVNLDPISQRIQSMPAVRYLSQLRVLYQNRDVGIWRNDEASVMALVGLLRKMQEVWKLATDLINSTWSIAEHSRGQYLQVSSRNPWPF